MSRTQAFATAARVMGDAHRDSSGCGYYAYVPFYDDEPHGPSTEIRATSRTAMLASLRARKAAMALALIAREEEIDLSENAADDLYYSIVEGYAHDWKKAVRHALRA